VGSLVEDTTVIRDGDRLSAFLSEDWEIWGPNGGYLAAIAMRAIGAAAPAGHRPVTFSCQYLASPRFEAVDLVVTPVRAGKRAWCLNVAMRQREKLCLEAQVWTTDSSWGPEQTRAKMPDAPSPASLRSSKAYVPEAFVRHRFWTHFESRPVDLSPSHAQNSNDPRLCIWQRLLDFDAGGDPFLDATRALVLIDMMPVPTFARSQVGTPSYMTPSLDLTVWLHRPAFNSDWVLIDSHADAAGGGLIHGGGRIWSSDGELIATGGGQFLVIGG
jgi:acyl-CoA thioesterase II